MSAVLAPLPWQYALWQQLSEQVRGEHLHHASLLAGPAGVGKQRFARALAALLLCHHARDGLNCGECQACNLLAAGSHGDFMAIHPEGDSRAIKIEQIRALVSFMGKTASLGQRKVVLIFPAEAMNLSAANALLKSLEEPGRDTFLILVSSMPGQLPATMRSRCQLLRFPAPAHDDAKAWLDTVTGEPARSEQLLQLTAGAPIAAAALFADDEKLQSLQQVHRVLAELAAGKYSAVQAAQALSKQTPGDLLLQVEQILHQQLRCADRAVLGSSRAKAGFALLDKTCKWRAALAAGSNPNVDLLKQQILLDFSRVFPLQSSPG